MTCERWDSGHPYEARCAFYVFLDGDGVGHRICFVECKGIVGRPVI